MSLPDLRTLVRQPASNESAWNALTAALAAVLEVYEEDDVLIVSAKRLVGLVRFDCLGSYGLRMEAVGNYYLAPKWKLDDGQLERLVELGWSPPTADEPSPEWIESDPDFCANYHIEMGSPVPCVQVAELAVATLREVYHLHHPRVLEYEAWGRNAVIKLPTLGLMVRPPRQSS